jgi:hypothetical protein
VYWPAVAAAGTVGVLLVAGAFAWARAHAPARPEAPAPRELAAVAATEPPAPVEGGAPAAAPPTAPALVPPLPAAPVEAQRPAPAEPCLACAGQTYGTRVTFLPGPADAARQARREGKLLFILHVSGNFEESKFT